MVICDNYGQAGAINYYSQAGVRADSFSADYMNWFELDRRYSNVISVKEDGGGSREFNETSRYFNSAFVAGKIDHPYAREFGTTLYVFLGAKININPRIAREIQEAKARVEGLARDY